MQRRPSLWLTGALALLAPAITHGQDTTSRANRAAYEAAMKCFIANGMLESDAKESNLAQRAETYEAQARRAFDLAVQLGGKAGLSGEHINQDMGLAQVQELPRMTKDPAYFRSAAATCKALGLM